MEKPSLLNEENSSSLESASGTAKASHSFTGQPPEESLAVSNTGEKLKTSPRATRKHICSRTFHKSTEDGLVFDYLMVTWEENGELFFMRHGEPEYDNIAEINGTPIPADHLRPLWHSGLPVVSSPAPQGMYIKRFNLLLYMGNDSLARWLLAEGELLSQFEKNPHPNVARFHGCLLSDDGRILELCLQRYPQTLAGAVATATNDLDKSSILQGIVAGVKYLHTLGIVHNDLNPKNIMLDDMTVPKIIDFDGSKPLGSHMKGSKVFTRPWGRRNEKNIAMLENDYLSLGLIALYLKGQFPPPNGILEADLIEPAIKLGEDLLTANSYCAVEDLE